MLLSALNAIDQGPEKNVSNIDKCILLGMRKLFSTSFVKNNAQPILTALILKQAEKSYFFFIKIIRMTWWV